MNLIKTDFDKNSEKLKKEFFNSKPFKHLVLNDFLDEKFAKKLLHDLKKEKFYEKNSDLFEMKQTNELINSKNLEIKKFISLLNSKDFLQEIGKITGVKLKGKLSVAGSLYEDGDYLLCHDDQLEGRKIAYIYYLTENFTNKDGGALVLRENKNGRPGNVAKRFVPKFNSLIMFEVSDISFHDVEEVAGKKKRYAIGGWFL